MKFVRYPISLALSERARVFSRAFAITDRRLWLNRYNDLLNVISKNIFMMDVIQREYTIELSVGSAIDRYQRTRIFPSLKRYPMLHNGLEFLHTLYEVRSRLSAPGQKRLDGMVRDGLNKNRGVASVAFELATANHFVATGCSVAFGDMEGRSGADLLVRKDGLEVEVECKHVSGDIGYQIHTSKFRELMHLQRAEFNYYINNAEKSIALLINIPGRLNNNEAYYSRLSALIRTALRERRTVNDDDGNEIRLRSLSHTYNINEQNAAAFARFVLHKVFDVSNSNAIAVGGQRKPCVFVGMVSRQQSRVVDRLFQQLRESANKQFSGTLPSLLCVYLSAVSIRELSSFTSERSGRTSLALAVDDLFTRRPQVSSIAFMSSDQPMWSTNPLDRNLSVLKSGGKGLLFLNRSATHPIAEDIKIFTD